MGCPLWGDPPMCLPPPHRVDGKDASYGSRLEHKRDLCRNGIVGHLRGGQEPPHKVRTPPETPPQVTPWPLTPLMALLPHRSPVWG